MIADAWTRLYDSAILSFYTESLSENAHSYAQSHSCHKQATQDTRQQVD